jgi:hypothetical protein
MQNPPSDPTAYFVINHRLKLVLLQTAMDILTRIADAEAAEKADREERAAEYYRQYLRDLEDAASCLD